MDNRRTAMNKMVQEAKRKREEQDEAISKKKLMNAIKAKFTTTIIGSLSAIEKEFGFLWGMSKDVDALTPEEHHMRKLWEEVRTEILNNGNNQLRATLNEIAQYSMKWEKYRVDFIVKQGDK